MKPGKFKSVLKIVGISCVCFVGGLLLRLTIQGLMGTRLIWLTFYPVVMIAALSAGRISGFLTGVFSALFALLGAGILGSQAFIATTADILGLVVFLGNTLMMSLVAGAMRSANDRSRAAQQQAEEANRAKSVFMAQMSHELRTPFNAILGFTGQLLRDQESTPRQREVLGIIHRSADHLLELINNVLDISRMDANKDFPDPKLMDIRDLVNDTVALLNPRTQVMGIQIVAGIAPGLPRMILGDARKIRQILINLLGNAIKFSGKTNVELNVDWKDGNNGGKSVILLEVTDHGPGIAPENHQEIFKPFTKLQNATETEGTGLGLSITRQLVEILDGEIRIESALGHGAKFTVKIPVEAADGVRESAEPMDDFAASWFILPGQAQKSCLAVDDNEENRLLIASYHDELGVSYKLASSGEEAILKCRESKPDLVWMDIRMNGMDGETAMKEIRSLPGMAGVPIVAVTASAFFEEKSRLLAAGFSDVIFKPFTLHHLAESMSRFLGLKFGKSQIGADTAKTEGADNLSMLTEKEIHVLDQALASLDPGKISAVIDAMDAQDRMMVGQLRKLASGFEFTKMKLILAHARGTEKKQ